MSRSAEEWVQEIRARHLAGHVGEALSAYETLLASHPDCHEALHLSGVALLQTARLAEAEARLRQAVAAMPNHAKAWNSLGLCLAAERPAEALAAFDAAAAADPSLAAAHYNRGCLLRQAGRTAEAEEALRLATSLDPRHAGARNNLALCLLDRARPEEAEAELRAALAGDNPNRAEILTNLAIALNDQGLAKEALASIGEALALAPESEPASHTRANILQDLGKVDEAEATYRDVLARRPDSHLTRHNLGLLLLSRRRFPEGWEQYESRLALAPAVLPAGIPGWRGQGGPGHLLVIGEQGVGDEILYAGMIPDLLARGLRVTVAADARLAPLLMRSFPGIGVIDRPEAWRAPPAAAAFDWVIMAGSLGRLLRPSSASFPDRRAYLRADPERTADLRRRLSDGRTLVGLSWRSAARFVGRFKTSQLDDWRALFDRAGCRVVSLQYGPCTDEIAEARARLGADIATVPDIDPLHDLDGFAALAAAMDHVVSVSNTTVHMAGALGVATTVIVPAARGKLWYWPHGSETTPWYPSLRLVRQARPGAWREAVVTATAWLPGA